MIRSMYDSVSLLFVLVIFDVCVVCRLLCVFVRVMNKSRTCSAPGELWVIEDTKEKMKAGSCTP